MKYVYGIAAIAVLLAIAIWAGYDMQRQACPPGSTDWVCL
jgi:hypothetical protein